MTSIYGNFKANMIWWETIVCFRVSDKPKWLLEIDGDNYMVFKNHVFWVPNLLLLVGLMVFDESSMWFRFSIYLRLEFIPKQITMVGYMWSDISNDETYFPHPKPHESWHLHGFVWKVGSSKIHEFLIILPLEMATYERYPHFQTHQHIFWLSISQ